MKIIRTSTIVLIALMFLVNVSMAEEGKLYQLDIEYDKGTLILKDIIVKPGFVPDRKIQPDIGYRLEVISFDESIMNSFKFDTPNIIFAEGTVELNNVNFTLLVDYFKAGSKINIYNPDNEKVLEIDVSHFAKTCGNNICDSYESYEDCPSDCQSGGKDDYCDKLKDNICDPDCMANEDSDCKEGIPGQFKGISYWYFLLIILFFIVVFIGYQIYKKKNYA